MRQLENRFSQSTDPGVALAHWLNRDAHGASAVEKLITDAQVVFGVLESYSTLRKFLNAYKTGKVPDEFGDCFERFNRSLAVFAPVPQVDPHEFYEDGRPMSWMVLTEETPLAIVSLQVRLVIDLVASRAILRLRRCKQCGAWYFARLPHQKFCGRRCQAKHFSTTEDFKLNRRQYMRERYWQQKNNNVK